MEDEEAEWQFAAEEYVNGKDETKYGKEQWAKYQKFGVLERADLYARDNGIKRTGTFAKKLKAERRATENFNAIAEDEAEDVVDTVVEDEQTKSEGGGAAGASSTTAYVPSKIDKVVSA